MLTNQNVVRWEVAYRQQDYCEFSDGCDREAAYLTRNAVRDSFGHQPVD